MVRAILFQEGSSFGAKYGLVLLLSELWRHLMVSCPALTLPCQGHSKLSGICPVDSYLPNTILAHNHLLPHSWGRIGLISRLKES